MKRSPLAKSRLLSAPGDHLLGQAFDVLEPLAVWLAVISVVSGMAGGAVLTYSVNTLWPSAVLPLVWVLGALVPVVVGLMWVKSKGWSKWLDPKLKGRAGEQAGAAALAELGKDGYIVVHDVDSGRGNIDHVLIGPGGVFAVETKYLSKDTDVKTNTVTVHGDSLRFNGRTRDRDGLEQARDGAAWLRERLASFRLKNGGDGVPVRAILMYPGWWVDEMTVSGVAVTNAKMVFGRIRNCGACMSSDEVGAVYRELLRFASRGDYTGDLD